MPTFEELQKLGLEPELLLLVMIFLPEDIRDQIIFGSELTDAPPDQTTGD